MIFRTRKTDEHAMLYVVEDTRNTIYAVVVDGYITKQDFIRRRNVCSMCGKSYPTELNNQTHCCISGSTPRIQQETQWRSATTPETHASIGYMASR